MCRVLYDRNVYKSIIPIGMPYCLNTLTFFVNYLKYDQQLQIKYCIKFVCKEQKIFEP